MRTRTAVVLGGGERTGARAALGAACLILVSVTASSCVLGNDNDRPVLAVDPFWETELSSGEPCREAGVRSMTWAIQDADGDTIRESSRLEKCLPLDFYGLVPGRYRLLLSGYDRDETERWRSTCTGLVLGRFDVLYACEVDQIEPDEEPPTDEDAGMADAGVGDAG